MSGEGTLEGVGGTPAATTDLPGPTEQSGSTGPDDSSQDNRTQAQGTTQGTTETGSKATDARGTKTQAAGDETFFDPKSIEGKPELESAYKSMQRAFTKKMQGFKDSQQKIDAYDAFSKDPLGTMTALAQQYGYNLQPRTGQNAQTGTQPNQAQGTEGQESWQPNSWDEVMDRATTIAEQRIMRQMQPLLGRVQDLQQGHIERELSEIDPGWQAYETDMMSNLQKHPTLADDPATLYRMSVPQDVLESRATQRALRKMEGKAETLQASGQSTVSKSQIPETMPKHTTLNDAVNFARQAVNPDGSIKPEFAHLFRPK